MSAEIYIDDHATRAAALLRMTFRDRPGWIAYALMAGASAQRVEDAIKTFRDGLPLEDAETATLERWGAALGMPRYPLGGDQPIVDDDDWFRACLLLRREIRRSRGTADDIIRVADEIDALWTDAGTTYLEHDAMTAIVGFLDVPLAGLVWAAWVMRRLPDPSVRLQLRSRPPTDYYGFAADPDALGLDEVGTPSGGSWSEAAE